MIRTVISLVDDMFFVSKIRATGKALGLIVKFPRTVEAFRETISDELPNLILVDLHNSKVDAIALAKELKAPIVFVTGPAKNSVLKSTAIIIHSNYRFY